MKKFLMCALSLMLVLCSAIALSGCGSEEKDGTTVMNVSLNPKVEFILDENNEVLSVNALNEEGNLIINGQAFVGKTSDEAVKLFISISKETGFLVSGNVNVDENNLDISFSGDEEKAAQLYNDLKEKVESYLTEQNITATLNKAKDLTKEYLQQQVEKCMPYLTKSEIDDMEVSELINNLKQSRKETANLVSEQLKEAYYSAKEQIVEQARVDYAISQIKYDLIKDSVESLNAVYKEAVSTLEETKKELFINENSAYQVALETLRQAKTQYLNYRNYVASLDQNEVTTAISSELARLKDVLNTAESSLNAAYTSAMNALTTVENSLESAYNMVVQILDTSGQKIDDAANQAKSSVNAALNEFKSSFATNYESAINTAKTQWNEMKTALTTGYAE